MKRIHILNEFTHGGRRYYAGDQLTVSPEDAGYFCGVGWATDLSGELPVVKPTKTDKELKVQDGKHGVKATSPGAK